MNRYGKMRGLQLQGKSLQRNQILISRLSIAFHLNYPWNVNDFDRNEQFEAHTYVILNVQFKPLLESV